MHSSIWEVQKEGILPRKTQALEMLLPAGIHRLGEGERRREEGGRRQGNRGKNRGGKGKRRQKRRAGEAEEGEEEGDGKGERK